MNTVEAPVQAGDMLAGKYRVERVLGVGAMGVVVSAVHVELAERRAIKFMLPSMLADTEGVERFLREARAAVRLKSQHVAKVQDVGRLETGAPYIVMEFLDGQDLKSLLEARGPLPVPEAAGYLMQACEAIAEAHALGIVHRDLKPANLFLTTGVNGAPVVKVLDFGIAKVMGGAGSALEMTATTQLLGTPLYMSPEQMRSTRNVDARSDIWSLGVILYRMLVGRPPFAGSTVTEICASVIGDQPDPPAMLRPDVPPALEAVVMRCLEKTPARRFESAAELARALAPFRFSSAAASPVAQAVHPPSRTEIPASHATPAPMSPVPIAALPVTSASVATPASSTVRGSTWTESTAAPAAPSSSRVGLIVGAIAVTAVLGAGGVLTQRARRPSPPMAASSAEPPPLQEAASTRAAAATSAEAATSAASAAPLPPSAAPTAQAATTQTLPVARPPAGHPTHKPAGGPRPADAFGDERK
jgi:serine/threonine protein kinase